MRRTTFSLACFLASASLIATSPAPAATTQPDHIVVIVMENKNYGEIVGNPAAGFINHTIARNSISLTDMHESVVRPSLPNYVWMSAGRTCGAKSDDDWGRTCTSVFDQLLAAGIPWHVYAEDYPGDETRCSHVAYSDSAPFNHYARKHDPALLFSSTSSGGGCRFHVARFPKRDTVNAVEGPKANFTGVTLDPFTVVIPNLCHDMHNSKQECGGSGGGIAAGDRWLSKNWADLVSAAGPGGVVILTWDEDGGSVGSIPTFIAGAGITAKGSRDHTYFSHSSTLRAIEDAFGLACLADACNATPLPITVAA